MIEISAFIAQEHLSLAQVASSVTCFLPEVSVNRMLVEGPSPSTHIRSRFPLHPSLSAMDGASIEGKGESAYVKTDAGNDHAGGNLPPFALST
jgi:hypothetical protein